MKVDLIIIGIRSWKKDLNESSGKENQLSCKPTSSMISEFFEWILKLFQKKITCVCV